MNTIIFRLHRSNRRVVCAGALILSSAALGQAVHPPRPTPQEQEEQSIKPQLRVSDAMNSPLTQHASLTRPVVPDRLREQLPDHLEKFKRTRLDARLIPVGPASMSEASAYYELEPNRGFEVRLLDSAGLPQVGDYHPQIPAPGQIERADGFERKGVEIKGFRSLVITSHGAGDVQIAAGPRIRIYLQGGGISGDALASLARGLDLAAIQQLAPQAPPAMPTKP
jgi:hypothetical protein